jgi:FlaA1/EpsC-like NDP-sugar epimerase
MVNITGTANMIHFAQQVQAERFVLISTDKAVSPVSIMGATKKMAEWLVRAASEQAGATRFLTVRFGNVLGSRGSVVPFFQQRIREGLPLPVTDPRMTRYFMTIKEAVLLVIEAMLLGESGATYILEMGEPVSIHELAKNLLALSGYDPEGGDAGPGIVMTGLRRGEKLHETLHEEHESLQPSSNPLIRKAVTSRPVPLLAGEEVSTLQELAAAGDQAGLRAVLADILGSENLRQDMAQERTQR